jgi:hypothetical protein
LARGPGCAFSHPFSKEKKIQKYASVFFRKTKCKSMVIGRVCLDRAKNSVKIEELRIVSEDSEKIVIFRLTRE